MTTATVPHTAVPRSSTPSRVSFGSLVRAEWISISSLRGNRASLIIGMLLVILPAAAFAVVYGLDFDGTSEMAQWLPTVPSLAGTGSIFAIAIAVLVGSAAFAKEHSTGSLRTQLTASTRRFGTMSAKALVVAVATFAASAIAFVLALVATWAVYAAFGMPSGVGSLLYDAVLPVLGGSLFTACSGVFALGIAALFRSETWAVTSSLLFIFVLPPVLLTLPWAWGPAIGEIVLGTTGQTLATPHASITGEILLDLVLTVAWGAVAFFGGAAVVQRRDV